MLRTFCPTTEAASKSWAESMAYVVFEGGEGGNVGGGGEGGGGDGAKMTSSAVIGAVLLSTVRPCVKKLATLVAVELLISSAAACALEVLPHTRAA